MLFSNENFLKAACLKFPFPIISQEPLTYSKSRIQYFTEALNMFNMKTKDITEVYLGPYQTSLMVLF